MEVLLPTDIVYKQNPITALSTRRGALRLTTALARTAGAPSEILVLKVPLLTSDPTIRRELRTRGMEIGSTFDGTPVTNLYPLPSEPVKRNTTQLVQEWRTMRAQERNPIPEDLTVLLPHLTPDLVIAALHATGTLPDGYSYADLFRDGPTHPLVDLLQYAMHRTRNITVLSNVISYYLTYKVSVPSERIKPPQPEEVSSLEQ